MNAFDKAKWRLDQKLANKTGLGKSHLVRYSNTPDGPVLGEYQEYYGKITEPPLPARQGSPKGWYHANKAARKRSRKARYGA